MTATYAFTPMVADADADRHAYCHGTHSGPCLLAVAPAGNNGDEGTIRHGAQVAIEVAEGIIRDGDATEATVEDLEISLDIMKRHAVGGSIMLPVTPEQLEAFARVTQLGDEYLGNVGDSHLAATYLVWQCEAGR